MQNQHLLIPVILLSAAIASGQARVTVRDKIVALPPVSICMDGATHKTVTTGHRLRPASGTSLNQYVGKAIEVSGQAFTITCTYVDVQTINVLPIDQWTVPSKTSSTVKVDFYGSGAVSDLFMLYLGFLKDPPVFVPVFIGPIHLDPVALVPVGTFVPLGSAAPYKSLSVPLSPALLNVDFHDQALVVHSKGTIELSNIDTFRF